MIVHSIVYVILGLLSLTAAYAAGAPVSKLPQEHQEPVENDEDNDHSL